MTLGVGRATPNVAARGERMLGLDVPGAEDENVAASRAACPPRVRERSDRRFCRSSCISDIVPTSFARRSFSVQRTLARCAVKSEEATESGVSAGASEGRNEYKADTAGGFIAFWRAGH